MITSKALKTLRGIDPHKSIRRTQSCLQNALRTNNGLKIGASVPDTKLQTTTSVLYRDLQTTATYWYLVETPGKNRFFCFDFFFFFVSILFVNNNSVSVRGTYLTVVDRLYGRPDEILGSFCARLLPTLFDLPSIGARLVKARDSQGRSWVRDPFSARCF